MRNGKRLRKGVTLLVLVAGIIGLVSSIGACVSFQLEMDYGEYRDQYVGVDTPDLVINVPIANFTKVTADYKYIWQHEGHPGLNLLVEESGFVEWKVFVPETGLYNIELEYSPTSGRSSEIMRELRIDGKVPFMGAKFLSFPRIWMDDSVIRQDNRGNDLRPRQVEVPRWQKVMLKDDMGYFAEPYQFYFEEGFHTITLVGRKEPMIIGSLTLRQAPTRPSYAEVQERYAQAGLQRAEDVFVKVQGQHAKLKSDPTLYPVFDQGDPTMEPYHPALIRLNSIGGWRWKDPGQWITWDVEVPEEGLYMIAIKGKQNENRASYSSRRLYVNGEVPFQEVDAVRFPYSTRYQMTVLGDESDEPYLFHLKEGRNEIKLEVVLGDMAALLQEAEHSLFALNEMYRKILMITSANPDPLRDYQLEKRIPAIIDNLREQAQIVDGIADELENFTQQKGGNVALLRDLSRQLRDMSERPHTIPKRLGAYRDNIAALGTWIIDTREQPLQIDYIIVASEGATLPEATATRRQAWTHELRAFKASFNADYDLVGDVYEADGKDEREPVTVWISAGRDQASALKEMIEDTFTSETGIFVNLQLVNMGVLLPATLAGMGPDVALGVPASDPVNFALRNAAEDLSQFGGFDEVQTWFMPSAFVPFTFRDQVYALPEQQPFPVMFYRTDILAEMGLEVPQTWDDVARLIPDLQKEHMNFGLPVSDQRSKQAGSGDIGVATAGAGSLAAHQGVVPFLIFLYQNGGELYYEDGIRTALDLEIAVEAFRNWTDLYELYNLPMQYDAANRFRIGEIPVLISSYTLYNQLAVFAPEIRGRWDFTLVPGTVRPDGTIDRSLPGGAIDLGSGGAAMMMKAAKNKEDAWEFMKWWVREDTQLRYGRELESLMGPAARYPTANVEAMRNLPWTVEEFDKLFVQWGHVRGVPEVPGGYMIGRHLDNAFRKVVLQKEEPRKTLLDYVRVMNEEISVKRSEFGLETYRSSN